MKRFWLLVVVLAIMPHVYATAQVPTPGNYRENFIEGNKLIEEGNWPMALIYFKEAYKTDSLSANVNYKMGVCYLNSASQKRNSLVYLRRAAKNVTRNYDPFEPTVKKAPEITFYYLAQSYHYNYQFDSAISYFESYKAILGTRDPQLTKDIDMRIGWCNNAKEFMATPLNLTITNLG